MRLSDFKAYRALRGGFWVKNHAWRKVEGRLYHVMERRPKDYDLKGMEEYQDIDMLWPTVSLVGMATFLCVLFAMTVLARP